MAITNKTALVRFLSLVGVLTWLTGCGAPPANPPAPPAPTPLSASNLNLIFVVSEDLAYQAPGDVNPKTANLTNQGLQRSLQMATFLQRRVLGTKNVNGIYAVAPMTHLQTANNYPDLASLEAVQQFAVLNQITLSSDATGGSPYTGHNYPINASYAPGPVPVGVAPPSPFCPTCQGLDFKDEESDNETLVAKIVKDGTTGFYVFSAPWETTSALLAKINRQEDSHLALPGSYQGPNYVYAISIAPSGRASFSTYDSNLNPPSTYPTLPPPKLVSGPCKMQAPFSITVTGGEGGAVIPAGANTNETLYFIRHAEAHPQGVWSDNNYVGAGQWRALDLPNALRGKVSPSQIFSIDPGQFSVGTVDQATDDFNYSTVAPALTAEPYAIANNLPYNLVSGFLMTDSDADRRTSDMFFTGGTFSNQKVLLAWAYQFIQPTVKALLDTYHGDGPVPNWPDNDYDTIWTVTLDAYGNVTVSNATCEGLDSALPPVAPQF